MNVHHLQMVSDTPTKRPRSFAPPNSLWLLTSQNAQKDVPFGHDSFVSNQGFACCRKNEHATRVYNDRDVPRYCYHVEADAKQTQENVEPTRWLLPIVDRWENGICIHSQTNVGMESLRFPDRFIMVIFASKELHKCDQLMSQCVSPGK